MLDSRGFLDEAPDSLGRAEHGADEGDVALGFMSRHFATYS